MIDWKNFENPAHLCLWLNTYRQMKVISITGTYPDFTVFFIDQSKGPVSKAL